MEYLLAGQQTELHQYIVEYTCLLLCLDGIVKGGLVQGDGQIQRSFRGLRQMRALQGGEDEQ